MMDMVWNEETRMYLLQCFSDTLTEDAKGELSAASNNLNYDLALLHLVADPSIDEAVHECVAVNLEEHIQSRWDSDIGDDEKQSIKALIVSTISSATKEIKTRLIPTVTVICNKDFITSFPDLLPTLRSILEAADGLDVNAFSAMNSVFSIVIPLLKKFCYEYKTQPIMLDLKYCVDDLAETLKTTVVRLYAYNAFHDDPAVYETHRLAIITQTQICSVFYRLSYMELPETLEDNANVFFTAFCGYITMWDITLVSRFHDGLALLHELQATVCEVLSLYMVKEEQVLNKAWESVFSALLVRVDAPSRERFNVVAITFMAVVATGVHHEDVVLASFVIEALVIPNAMWTDVDQCLIKDNPLEFIRRDMERTNFGTTRGSCRELLRGLERYYKYDTNNTVKEEVVKCLRRFHENQNVNWRYKECAIYLAVSLATKAQGMICSCDVIDVESFFTSVIVPELQRADHEFPMLKAGALKFSVLFLYLVPRHVILAHLGDLVRCIRSEETVVHSYASAFIEKLLLLRPYTFTISNNPISN